jgi:oligosaccharide repeat unit polymerase
MSKTVFRVALFVLYAFTVVGMIYIILDGPMVDEIFAEPFYVSSVLLYILSLVLGLIIINKSRSIPPSIVLLMMFLAVPIIGPLGYGIFIKIYGSFHDTQLSFAYPTFVWMVGTTVFMFGIFIVHGVIRKRKFNGIVLWDLKRTSLLIWCTVAIAFFFTAYVLFKIGYIPFLSSNIDLVRKGYEGTAGDYPLKLSRFWLLAASLSSMLFFIRAPKRLYSIILVISSGALLVYGQRTYTFLAIISFVLIYFKFRKPKIGYLITFGLFIVVAFVLYADFRGGRSFKELTLPDIVILNLFGEWREYAYVVNELNRSHDFYKADLYVGALAPIFPKQIWAAFGIDKNKLIHEKSAVYIFGREFENELGIRIGTIGEAYAGYGIFYGVCLQMFIFGLIFGALEKIYLCLNQLDARLCLIVFLLSLLLSLPITTLYVTMAQAVFFGFFFIVYQLIATYRVSNTESMVMKYQRTKTEVA